MRINSQLSFSKLQSFTKLDIYNKWEPTLSDNSKSIIEFRDVYKDYPGTMALKGVSFSVQKGKVHGFLGPNGAGKSTAMNILAGLIPPSRGDVFVLDQSVVHSPFEARENIGFLPENPPLYDSMRVRSYLEFVAEIHSVRNRRTIKLSSQVNDVIEKCGLQSVEKKLIGNLSKGFRQRVGIAQAIVFDPSIIIFDEPTNGLDPDAIVDIRRLTLELGRERTVLLSSHILSEVELMCDDITIIRDGAIARTGTLGEIQASFQPGKLLNAVVLDWSAEKEGEFNSIFKTEKIEAHKREASTALRIQMNANSLKSLPNADEDLRSQVSRFFVEKGCGLVHFEEHRPQLEDIFHLVTQDSEAQKQESYYA